ncbi:hypothetical protein D9619_007215 [Psilocybe cf. subviscida]|uniref:Uncharacterized protein n=1 Tax=Psilocybe cf. subviscida TaxID=2480587 RepID=A0A8H5EX14_9AGAR|nr:hypothetical protein D9619_007215 [Psilocybe cf. subviscida]
MSASPTPSSGSDSASETQPPDVPPCLQCRSRSRHCEVRYAQKGGVLELVACSACFSSKQKYCHSKCLKVLEREKDAMGALHAVEKITRDAERRMGKAERRIEEAEEMTEEAEKRAEQAEQRAEQAEKRAEEAEERAEQAEKRLRRGC